MRTTLDVEDILWQLVKNSALATAVTGGVYKQKRPANSNNEDIVVNCLPINSRQLQQAVANVNIHVPNKPVTLGSVTDRSVPDHARLKELATLATGILDETFDAAGYGFDIQQQQMIEDDVSESHYVNFRINFISVNL